MGGHEPRPKIQGKEVSGASSVLNAFFNPRGVAVIGASDDPKKLGYEVFKNLREYRGGRVYPVNPRREYVQGVKAFKSVLEVPDPVDMAVIVVPKKFVKQTLIECGERGVKAVVIITAGFSETGPEGARDEEELVEIARKYGIRIVGPNCVGVMNTRADLNATFIMPAKKGSVAFISQSGALGGAIIYKTVKEKVGFSKFVSVGNMADVDFTDLMEYLANDPETTAIALYVEGLKNGKRFMEVARRVTKVKPVIALKGGRSEAGSKAVASHTGSLAGNFRVYEAAFKQAGILVADTIDEMISMARAFTQPLPKGRRVAVLTNAGGAGVLLTDQLEARGLRLADLSEGTREHLRSFLPPIASVRNPVDTTAGARGEDYYECVKALMRDEGVDLLIVACVVPTFAGMTPTEHAEGALKALREVRSEGIEKPVLAMFMAGHVSEKARGVLEENGIPTYERPEDAAAAAEALVKYAAIRLNVA